MKMRKLKLTAVLLAWLAGLAFGQTTRGDEAVPSERRLPRNVVAYASLRNVTEFKEQWSKTLFGQMLNDDALADVRAQVAKHLSETSEQLESQLGMSLEHLLAIPDGEIAVAAIVLPPATLAGVMLLDFGEHRETVEKLLEKGSEASEKQGLKRIEEEIDDTHIVSFQREAEDGDKKSQDSGAYFMKDTFLVLGTNVAALKAVLSRWDGKQDRSFADNDTWRYVTEKCRDEHSDGHPQFVWFFDPLKLAEAVIASQPQLADQAAIAMGMIPTLGIDKFKGVGGAVELAHGDFNNVTRTLIVIDRSPQGVGNVFQFDAAAQSPPKWLSADWSGYTALNWNVAKAYGAVESLVDNFLGPGALASHIQNLADHPETGNIHVKKDLIDQITGTIVLAEDQGQSGGKSAAGMLFGIQIKNAATARATLTKVVGLIGGKVNEREFQGETLYDLELPAGDEDGGDDAPNHLGIAVSEGHILVATDVRLVERVLRGTGDGETLADSPAYKKIAAKFPAKTASISFSRVDTQYKVILDALKSGQVGNLFGGDDLFDFSKLPDFDSIKKYLPPTGSYMEVDARGLRITSFSQRNSD
jgi:hypothetical protein